jgi:hypothetical protein
MLNSWRNLDFALFSWEFLQAWRLCLRRLAYMVFSRTWFRSARTKSEFAWLLEPAAARYFVSLSGAGCA